MSTTPMTKIREEFTGAKQLNQFWTKQTTVDWDKIADWFINRFQQELSSLEEEIGGKLTVYYRSKFSQDCSRNETEEEKNTEMIALSDVLEIIRQHKEGYEK